MSEKPIKDLMELYLAKAKEFNFKPDNIKTKKGQREAIRYLLATGCIPVNAENLTLAGKQEFHVSAEKLPDSLKEAVLKASQQNEWDWDTDEEYEDEELKVISTKLEGIWVKQGNITGAKVARQREVRLTTVFNVPKLNIKV